MSFSKVQKYIDDGMSRTKPVPRVHLNPLNSHSMNKYFKSKKNKQVIDFFKNSHVESKRLLELTQLFEKFDMDDSGTIDLNELVHMFHIAGIKINGEELKKVFKVAKDVNIVKGTLTLQEFMKLMLSKELDEAFKVFLQRIRDQFLKHDYS